MADREASLGSGYVPRAEGATVSLSAPRGEVKEYPRWKKYTGNPVMSFAEQTAPSLYWPDIMDTSLTSLVLPGGHRWLLVYSTDHGSTGAGIYWATAPDPFGTWTPRGKLYSNYETPSLIWDAERGLLNIYMHGNRATSGAVGVQTTFLVTTPDLVTFTTIGNMLDIVDTTMQPGDGHTGYFKPYRFDDLMFGTHLRGGTSASRAAMAYSLDGGRTWRDDPRALGYNRHLTNGNDENMSLYGSCIFLWHGELWATTLRLISAAGGANVASTLYSARVRPDLRGFADKPILLNLPAQDWEGALPGGPNRVFMYDGELVGVYRAGGPQGGIGLMTLEG